MKTLLSLLVLFSVAQAETLNTSELKAGILTMNIDPKVWFAKDSPNGGSVSVNTEKKEITLSLTRKPVCAPNHFCPMHIVQVANIVLPLVSVTEGECKTVVYFAKEDKRPVDGAYQALKVTDNTHFYETCRTPRAVDATDVQYRTITLDRHSGGSVQTDSTFTATALKAQ